jgi:hypothetical protein
MRYNFEENKNVKHKLDELYSLWLGLEYLFQPFEELDRVTDKHAEIKEIRQLLDEGQGDE